jgi:hypothetical protein
MDMRFLLLVLTLSAVAACDKPKGSGNEVEKLETFTEREHPTQSRDQIRYYAETEGKMRPIESDIKATDERIQSGLQLSAEKAAALESLKAAVKEARTQITAIRKQGSLDWEKMKDPTDQAISRAQVAQKIFDDLP